MYDFYIFFLAFWTSIFFEASFLWVEKKGEREFTHKLSERKKTPLPAERSKPTINCTQKPPKKQKKQKTPETLEKISQKPLKKPFKKKKTKPLKQNNQKTSKKTLKQKKQFSSILRSPIGCPLRRMEIDTLCGCPSISWRCSLTSSRPSSFFCFLLFFFVFSPFFLSFPLFFGLFFVFSFFFPGKTSSCFPLRESPGEILFQAAFFGGSRRFSNGFFHSLLA